MKTVCNMFVGLTLDYYLLKMKTAFNMIVCSLHFNQV